MPDISPLPVQALLNKYNLRPDKRLGQNFLIDESALRRVVEAAEITPNTQVLEIGPGLGSLTRHLALAAEKVVAVELDGRLVPALEEVISPFANVQLLQADILKVDVARVLSGRPYVVVANIPYYITSAVTRHLLEAGVRPLRMVLTVQREVALRICASPGEMSLLALSVQLYGVPEIRGRIPAGAFYPVPQVDSAIVRVDLTAGPKLPAGQHRLFFRLAKAGFSQKRKTLRNALAGGMGWSPDEAVRLLQTAGIDAQRRAETLSVAEWGRLVEAVQQDKSEATPT
jgi:16S rRNA (adenine1518-N6/adenine1519-N6)-dimethyltransferase